MEKLTKLLNTLMADFNIAKLLPDLVPTLDKISGWIRICLYVGPIFMLLLGLWYFFVPPKEANRVIGFQAFFGMGTVKAWRFTQRLAGAVWGILGLVFMFIMASVSTKTRAMELPDLAITAIKYLLIQFALVAIVYVLLQFVVAMLYTLNGNSRWERNV